MLLLTIVPFSGVSRSPSGKREGSISVRARLTGLSPPLFLESQPWREWQIGHDGLLNSKKNAISSCVISPLFSMVSGRR